MSWEGILPTVLRVWLLLLAFIGTVSAEQKVYRILPLGDSITEGGKTFANYRYPLWEKLFSAGYLVEFVGSRTSESRAGPLRHEGYGGKNAEFLAGVLAGTLRTNQADVVLIHAGHNHTNTEAPVSGIIAATEAMVRTARSANPGMIILLAQVIPSGKLPKYEYLPELNVELAALAARLHTLGQPVVSVNMADGFDWQTDTIADHVHPNARGAEKMANRWFGALTNVLEPPKRSFQPRLVPFKQVGDESLRLHLFAPPERGDTHLRPAIVFFFGGGWSVGSPIQFYAECAALAARGWVAISAEYRIGSLHHTTPFESVADAKSAVRWLRQHATELRIDPRRIVAAGGSAGGQIAAAAGLVPGLDEPGEDTQVSSQPDALLLYYAVVDNGPDGYGPAVVKGRYQEFSPLHNIRSNPPPALFFLGTTDRLVPVATAEEFQRRMRAMGGRCDLRLFPGAGHPIFNYRQGDSPAREAMLEAAQEFLASLGFQPDPVVKRTP